MAAFWFYLGVTAGEISMVVLLAILKMAKGK